MDTFKLLNVVFPRNGQGIFVSFPYFRASVGIVSRVALMPNGRQVDLKPGGKITSHLVKYSHHVDGRAHFSQDKKVFTSVVRFAVPLDEVGGHLFSAHFTGYEHFDAVSEHEAAGPFVTQKRTLLNFDFSKARPPGLKIVGAVYPAEWIRLPDSIGAEAARSLRPRPVVLQRGDNQRVGFIAAPPAGFAGSHRILWLSAEAWSGSNSHDRPNLLFMGGFDPVGVMTDPSQPAEMLMAAYPVDSLDELRGELGTIDFV